MTIHQGDLHRKDLRPALVLNADFQPLSYAPLSLWNWQDAIKAVFLDKVSVIKNYDEMVRSPGFEMPLPAVIALRAYQKPPEHAAFTRMNVSVRDRHRCVYCGSTSDLNFDHVVPRSGNRKTGVAGRAASWQNTVLSCVPCNQRKGNRSVADAGMVLPYEPYQPTTRELMQIAREFPPKMDMSAWSDFCYWSVPLATD